MVGIAGLQPSWGGIGLMVTNMKILCFLCSSLWAQWVFAYHPSLPGVIGKQGSGDTYSDIVFSWTAESTTFGEDDYSAGDSTPTATGSGLGINSTAAIVGSNGIYIPTSGSRYYSFSVSSNDIAPAAGRIGFWYTNTNTTTMTPIYWMLTTADRADLRIIDDELSFSWRDGNVSRTGCTTTTNAFPYGTHFIEIAYDTDYREIFVDGSSVLECATAISLQSPTTIHFGDYDATSDAAEKYMDHIRISNDKTRNLYLLRNLIVRPQ